MELHIAILGLLLGGSVLCRKPSGSYWAFFHYSSAFLLMIVASWFFLGGVFHLVPFSMNKYRIGIVALTISTGIFNWVWNQERGRKPPWWGW